MPAPRIRLHWRDAIFAILGEAETMNAKLTTKAVEDELWKRAGAGMIETQEGEPVGDVPSTSTIGRVVRDDWAKLKESERKDYRLVRWPETFRDGALPWQTAPAVFELLRYLTNERPTVRLARWYWWLSAPLMLPNASEAQTPAVDPDKAPPPPSVRWRMNLARTLAGLESLGLPMEKALRAAGLALIQLPWAASDRETWLEGEKTWQESLREEKLEDWSHEGFGASARPRTKREG